MFTREDLRKHSDAELSRLEYELRHKPYNNTNYVLLCMIADEVMRRNAGPDGLPRRSPKPEPKPEPASPTPPQTSTTPTEPESPMAAKNDTPDTTPTKVDSVKSFTVDAGGQVAEGVKDAAAYQAMNTLFDSLVAMVAPTAPALAAFYATSTGGGIIRAVGPYLLGAAARMELLPQSALVEQVALRSIRASSLFLISPWIEKFRQPIVQIFKRAADDMNLQGDWRDKIR